MDFSRKLNISKGELFEKVNAIPEAHKNRKFFLKVVFIRENDNWKYLVGTCSINSDKPYVAQEKYKGFYFISAVIEGTLLDVLGQLYAGYSVHEEMPDIKFSGYESWEEELIPSHISRTKYPVRAYTARISNLNSFNDTKLIGYQEKFHSSAKKYIRDFLDLLGPLDRKESKEGGFVIGVEDTRNRILTENNMFLAENNSEDVSLVGEVDKRDVRILEGQEITSLDEVETVELWLVDKKGEVLDYISSSEWPHVYLSAKDWKRLSEDGGYESIISEGEGSKCEFKPYIRLQDNQNSKIGQIIKTACAFSNAHGGYLFIGINDNAEVEDVTVDLRKDYKGDPNKAVYIYISQLKKLLKENLTIDDCFTVRSETIFSKPVIIVSVERVDEINSVRSERTAYIRKGASSMKMLPEEIQNKVKKSYF